MAEKGSYLEDRQVVLYVSIGQYSPSLVLWALPPPASNYC